MDDRKMYSSRTHQTETLSEEALAASLTIDYAAIAAATAPDQPGGRIVYNSGDYETDEEADEALDDFFADVMDRVFDRLMEAAHGKA